jgi:hypothetical protein
MAGLPGSGLASPISAEADTDAAFTFASSSLLT